MRRFHGLIQREILGPDPSGKSQVAMGFIRNTGTHPSSRSNWTRLPLEGGSYDSL